MILKKKQKAPPPAPGKIIVGDGGIYTFTSIPRPLPKKKSIIPKGTGFKIISACCEIIEGKTGSDNQINITKHRTFWSVRVIKSTDNPKNPNTPKSRL